MTDNSRCQGRKKMMGRGAEGGCGTEEKTCPVTRVSPAATTPASFPASLPEKSRDAISGVDLYSQAVKALSERSPFDSNEVVGNTVATLPSGLASLLSKQSDSKKKHKRPHSETKSSRKGSTEKSKGGRVWTVLEDYFRELTLQDIERLHQFSSSLGSLLDSNNSCFQIPVLGNGRRSSGVSNNDGDRNKVENGHADVTPAGVKEEEVLDVDSRMSDAGAFEDKEEVNRGDDKQQNVKLENGNRDSLGVVEEGPTPECSSSQLCSSIEWVLGSRNRMLLTSTRPSKKRKLSGGTAGLERLIVAEPCEGSSSLCHVCSMGDTKDQLNQLVVCKSCNVVVHQKCYGVQGEIDASWLCSWCKHKIGAQAGPAHESDRPCVFCPKSGGALKPFQNAGSGNDGSVEFAHLFCSMWMPEAYIDDTRLMEPVLCNGMKDVRGKSVCNLCKMKIGSCVRCSDGGCRTSFHPTCAREARNKLEIWGRFGCDDIEMRVFCAKHSTNVSLPDCVALENNELDHSAGGDSLNTSNEPVVPRNKIKKLKIGCKIGDKVTFNIRAADAKSNNLGEREWQDMGLKDVNFNTKVKSGSSDGQKLSAIGLGGAGEDVKSSHYLDLGLVLKKLVDRGKVSLEQIAADTGFSEDSLASRVIDNNFSPELYCKILNWLKEHSYLDTTEKDWRARLSCLMPLKAELKTDDSSEAVAVRDLDITDVPVKSVPPRRRTVGNKEDKVISLWNDKMHADDVSLNVETEHKDVNGDYDNALGGMEEIMVEANGFETQSAEPSPISECILLKSDSLCDVNRNGAEDGASSGKSSLFDLDLDTPSCSSVDMVGCCDGGNTQPGIDSSVHPYIQKRMEEVRSWLTQRISDCNGCLERESLALEQTLSAEKEISVCIDEDGGNGGVKLEDLCSADEGIFDLSPENEVEGELIFFQQQLLHNAVALKHHSDQLVCKITRDLPHEMDSVRKRRWDSVLVNQYIYELKEARKQGRKERRHKEAQAVLAAATAAAAASSRVSSLRKDAVDDTPQQENQYKLENTRVRGNLSSLSVPRAKVSSQSLDFPKVVSDGYSDRTSKEHPKSCDICRRPESLLNPILVCSSCKVAVHLNCYRSVKESTGPWYCEFCEESSTKISRATLANICENLKLNQECGLCGTSNGALRKSSNGQWVHAFCAEWVFDSTFRRGQVSPIVGMESVPKGNDTCSVCQRRYGACIKCNYGNCQSTFHPSCARDAEYYLYTKYIGGGKMQHKAYCSKHSLEQRAKAETQKHGAEDLKFVKQHRVELEKLRLLCERIVKREKLKRELVICNQDILASKRDSLVVSMLVHRPPFSSHESSDSATTSLKGHVDGSRSCSDAMQRSDDITVDSALSAKRCIRLPQSIDNDQKTEDSSTSQTLPTPKPAERVSFAGKQIPIRAALASRNFSHSAENILQPKKHLETFEKELVMTSDQASMKNRRLPKGYIYVPIDYISNGKPVKHESVEKEEVDD